MQNNSRSLLNTDICYVLPRRTLKTKSICSGYLSGGRVSDSLTGSPLALSRDKLQRPVGPLLCVLLRLSPLVCVGSSRLLSSGHRPAADLAWGTWPRVRLGIIQSQAELAPSSLPGVLAVHGLSHPMARVLCLPRHSFPSQCFRCPPLSLPHGSAI